MEDHSEDEWEHSIKDYLKNRLGTNKGSTEVSAPHHKELFAERLFQKTFEKMKSNKSHNTTDLSLNVICDQIGRQSHAYWGDVCKTGSGHGSPFTAVSQQFKCKTELNFVQ